jgi:hypothetical protein
MDFSKLSDDQLAIAEKVAAEAQRQGINPDFVLAMVMQESGFNPKAISKKGAIGVMQLMPDTAKGLDVDPNDVDQNIRGGVKLIKQLTQNKNIGNDPHKVLMGYNAGPGTKFLKTGNEQDLPDETLDHVLKIADFSGGKLPQVNFAGAKEEPPAEEPAKTEEAKVPDVPSEGKPLAKVAERKEEPKKRELSVPMSAIAGAGLGAGSGTAYATLKAKIDAFNQLQEALSRRSEPIFGEAPARMSSTGRLEPTLGEPKTYGGEKWQRALTGVDVPNAQMNKQSLDLGKQLAEAVGPKGGPFAGGEIRGGVIVGPEIGAKTPPPPPEPKPAPAKPSSRFPTAARYAGALLKYPVGGALAGLGTGATLADVYNRYYGGDKTGATISGLGGAAGLASMFVPSMGALPAAAVAAPLYLMASDRLKRLQKHPEEYKLYESMFDPMGNYTGP